MNLTTNLNFKVDAIKHKLCDYLVLFALIRNYYTLYYSDCISNTITQ